MSNVTPEYTKRAIRNYNNKFDRVPVNLPKGTKERIKELTGKSCNIFLNEVAMKELDRLETEQGKEEPANNQVDDTPDCFRQ